jgi:hypothetical protein
MNESGIPNNIPEIAQNIYRVVSINGYVMQFMKEKHHHKGSGIQSGQTQILTNSPTYQHRHHSQDRNRIHLYGTCEQASHLPAPQPFY